MDDALAFMIATQAIALVVWGIATLVVAGAWAEEPYGTHSRKRAARTFLLTLGFGWVLALLWPLFLIYLLVGVVGNAIKDARG
jgi:hypothetical protein